MGTPTASRRVIGTLVACLLVLLASGVWWAVSHLPGRNELVEGGVTQRNQQRLTFAPGLQTDVTWSPDGRFIAYTSNQAGNFDIWVQPVPSSGGDAVQVTRSSAQERQPVWSPDNTSMAFSIRTRRWGAVHHPFDLEVQKSSSPPFGVRPQWTSDGAYVLFASTDLTAGLSPQAIQGRVGRTTTAGNSAGFYGTAELDDVLGSAPGWTGFCDWHGVNRRTGTLYSLPLLAALQCCRKTVWTCDHNSLEAPDCSAGRLQERRSLSRTWNNGRLTFGESISIRRHWNK